MSKPSKPLAKLIKKPEIEKTQAAVETKLKRKVRAGLFHVKTPAVVDSEWNSLIEKADQLIFGKD